MTFNKIYVELTNICGLSCSFCPSQKPPTNTMNVDDFESIIKQVSNYTNIITFHMFGDPLTLSNLEQYLDITHKYNLKVEIVTSGYYLNKFNPKIFLHTAIRQINFSLNSFNKNDMGMSLDEYLQYMFDICNNEQMR
jgi:MoaA/NifB/PqqE/SkfB family radical SAM enzyme